MADQEGKNSGSTADFPRVLNYQTILTKLLLQYDINIICSVLRLGEDCKIYKCQEIPDPQCVIVLCKNTVWSLY